MRHLCSFSNTLSHSKNPPLLIVCDLNRFRVHTNWTNSVSQVQRKQRQRLRRSYPRSERLRKSRTLRWQIDLATATYQSFLKRLRAFRVLGQIRQTAGRGLGMRRLQDINAGNQERCKRTDGILSGQYCSQARMLPAPSWPTPATVPQADANMPAPRMAKIIKAKLKPRNRCRSVIMAPAKGAKRRV